ALEREDAQRLALAVERRGDGSGDLAVDLALHGDALDLVQKLVAWLQRVLALSALEIADRLLGTRPLQAVDRAVVIAADGELALDVLDQISHVANRRIRRARLRIG